MKSKAVCFSSTRASINFCGGNVSTLLVTNNFLRRPSKISATPTRTRFLLKSDFVCSVFQFRPNFTT
jgi:hypothetical protein